MQLGATTPAAVAPGETPAGGCCGAKRTAKKAPAKKTGAKKTGGRKPRSA